MAVNPEWSSKLNNLLARRATSGVAPEPAVCDYASHVSWAAEAGIIRPSDTVLDVGCGDTKINSILTARGHYGSYFGLDPAPLLPSVFRGKIEDGFFMHPDVVIAFAVLDGVEDLDRALATIAALAKRSILVLSAYGLDPDQYHTFKIYRETLETGFPDFILAAIKELNPCTALFGFTRRNHG